MTPWKSPRQQGSFSNELYPQVKDKVSCPILIIENFVDEAEVEEKLLPKVKELAGE